MKMIFSVKRLGKINNWRTELGNQKFYIFSNISCGPPTVEVLKNNFVVLIKTCSSHARPGWSGLFEPVQQVRLGRVARAGTAAQNI
jgi:hypothetical protein